MLLPTMHYLHDRLNGFHIARTPTEDAAERVPHVGFGRAQILIEQRFGSEDKCGGAVAALNGPRLDKRGLPWMHPLARSQPFDRRHLSAVRLRREERAAIDHPTNENNVGHATRTVFAAVLDTQETLVPQRAQKHFSHLDGALAPESIDDHGDPDASSYCARIHASSSARSITIAAIARRAPCPPEY
jgi:hypothetical protein